MTLKEQLETSLKDAMRAGDEVRKRALRMVLSAIRLAEVEKGQPLDDAGVTGVLLKEVKSQQEAIADAQKANRPDLIANTQAEIAVLEGFLPRPFSPEELEQLARQAISETGATSQKEMGMVMKTLMPRLQGRATGDQASQVVRRLLSPAAG
jgi:uncharacterized protein YqeY